LTCFAKEYRLQLVIVIKKTFIILAHAMVGWILCGLTMGLGMGLLSLTTAIIIHAIAAPLFIILLSWFYFKKFNFTTPLQTAIIFVAFVIFMDVFIVATEEFGQWCLINADGISLLIPTPQKSKDSISIYTYGIHATSNR